MIPASNVRKAPGSARPRRQILAIRAKLCRTSVVAAWECWLKRSEARSRPAIHRTKPKTCPTSVQATIVRFSAANCTTAASIHKYAAIRTAAVRDTSCASRFLGLVLYRGFAVAAALVSTSSRTWTVGSGLLSASAAISRVLPFGESLYRLNSSVAGSHRHGTYREPV